MKFCKKSNAIWSVGRNWSGRVMIIDSYWTFPLPFRGVARNLFRRGTKLAGGLGDGRLLAGSRVIVLMGVWGVAPRS